MFAYPIYHSVSGAITMGFVVAGLFFLRFWRRTGDGLFVAFACAIVCRGDIAMVEDDHRPAGGRAWPLWHGQQGINL